MSPVPEHVEQTLYTPSMKEELLSLLHASPYKGVIWEWQFEQSPFSTAFDPIIFTEHGRIIGFNGVMPIHLQYLGEERTGLWSCDFYIDERFRGQGLGKRIKQVLLTHSPIIMSFGVSDDAARVLAKMGWRLSPEVHTYRQTARPRTPRDWGLWVLQLINRVKGLSASTAYKGHIQCVSHLPDAEEVDALWQTVRSGYAKAVVRSFAYLHWKYQRHPLGQYVYWCARSQEGRLEGVLVTRVHDNLVRLVDYLGPSKNYALKRGLIRRILREKSGQSAIMTTSDEELGRALCDLGGFRARTQPRFFVHSSVAGDTEPECHWFLMSGDSDGEILTAAAEATAQSLRHLPGDGDQ